MSKDYAREWLREHAEKGNRRVAFERAKNPERWVRVALEVTRLEVVLKEMPIGAMDESNEDTKGVERPEVDPIDLTGDSDDEMCCGQ